MKPATTLATTLVRAVEAGDAKAAARALADGADPHLEDGSGRLLAARCVERGQLAIVKAFLDAGLDAGRTVEHGWSLLMCAHDEPVARALLALCLGGVPAASAHEARQNAENAETAGKREPARLRLPGSSFVLHHRCPLQVQVESSE